MFTGIVIPSKKHDSWFVTALAVGQVPKKPSIGRMFKQSILPKSEKAEEILNSYNSFRFINARVEDKEELKLFEPVTIPILAYVLSLPNKKGMFVDHVYDTYLDYGLSALVKEDVIIPRYREAHFGEITKSEDKIWPLIERI
jgi:hypothetical protein